MQTEGQSNMQTGVVKWFNGQKGYGFITPEEGGKDLFVHFSDIEMEGFKVLREGQKVTFVAVNGPKGPQATKVHSNEDVRVDAEVG